MGMRQAAATEAPIMVDVAWAGKRWLAKPVCPNPDVMAWVNPPVYKSRSRGKAIAKAKRWEERRRAALLHWGRFDTAEGLGV